MLDDAIKVARTDRVAADPLDLTIVLVSYNTREMTLACLKSVVEQTRSIRYEIVVVDNNSTDGSAEAIRAAYPNVRLIRSNSNLGFARANNLAAADSKAERLLLLNPDTLVLDRAIDKLFKFANETPSFGIWGGRTVFADGSLNPKSCWRQMTLWSMFCALVGLSLFRDSPVFYSEGYGGWRRDTVRSVDIVTGCFFMVDRELWGRLCGFDPTFFMYAEEADLCLRAAKAGARPSVTPTATIVHYGGASERVQAEKTIKMLAGKMTLLRRHWAPPKFRLGRFLMLFHAITRRSALSLGARFLQKPEWRQRAEVWGTVWDARERWANGWPETSHPDAPPALG